MSNYSKEKRYFRKKTIQLKQRNQKELRAALMKSDTIISSAKYLTSRRKRPLLASINLDGVAEMGYRLLIS